ncbi:MAG: hypothetical protein RL757_2153 [Bacteroidota bacterium]
MKGKVLFSLVLVSLFFVSRLHAQCNSERLTLRVTTVVYTGADAEAAIDPRIAINGSVGASTGALACDAAINNISRSFAYNYDMVTHALACGGALPAVSVNYSAHEDDGAANSCTYCGGGICGLADDDNVVVPATAINIASIRTAPNHTVTQTITSGAWSITFEVHWVKLWQVGTVGSASFWMKADQDIAPLGSAGALTSWLDVTTNNTMTITGAPQVVQNVINFNPIVRFTGAEKLVGNSSIGMDEAFAVVSYAGATTIERGTVISPTTNTDAGDLRYYFRSTSGALYTGLMPLNQNPAVYVTTTVPADGEVAIYNVGVSNARKNGVFGGSGSTGLSMDGIPQVGDASSNTFKLKGDLAEVILFDGAVSATDRLKIETYLAVKYGITLGGNYVNMAGSTVYNITTYGNDIAGIGREDNENLHQRQSKSLNSDEFLTVGLREIAASNTANSHNLIDGTYAIWGNDNGALTSSTTSAAASAACPVVGLDSWFNRKWKVTETGSVDSLHLRIPTASLVGLDPAQPIYLVYSTDNFATFTYKAMTLNGANQELTLDFPANATTYFTFAGTGTGGGTTYCAGSHSINWKTQGWTAGALSKSISLAGGLTMTATVSNPNSILRAGYPKMFSGFPLTFIDSKSSANAVTWQFAFNQMTSGVSFPIYDIDGVGTLREHVTIQGYRGATLVSPTLTKPALSATSIAGNVVTGNVNNLSTFSAFGRVDVSFGQPIDKVVITYKNNRNTYRKISAAMAIGDIAIYCPAAPTNKDNINVAKFVTTGGVNIGDTITYNFKINNGNCTATTIDFNDNLPSGMAWVANSYVSPLVGGTLNSYAGSQNFSLTGVSAPVGITTFSLNAVLTGPSTGTYSNEASITVNGNTYPSINGWTGARTATPVVAGTPLPIAPLTITKSVSPASVNQSGIVTFTYDFNNTSGAPIAVDFADNIQPDSVTYVAASLVNPNGGSANVYADEASLGIAGMSIPVGNSTVTVQAQMHGVAVGTYQNVATITPTAASGFKEEDIFSNSVSWTVTNAPSGAAFGYDFNCNGSVVTGTFVANAATGQTGTLTIPITVSSTGSVTLTVTGAGFSGTRTLNLTTTTASVTIPITYDGSGAEGTRALTVNSTAATGTCGANAIIQAACKSDAGRIGR